MRKIFLIIVLGIILVLSGCLGDSSEDDPFLVRVNDYKIKSGDVDSLFKFEVESDLNFHSSNASKADFVENLIQTQIFIQEAKKRKLDQSELFRHTIQRYWESTLIRDLLAEKEEQLRNTAHVSKEEVEAYYGSNEALFKDRSFEELRPDLMKLLKDQEVASGLESWVEDLENAADIEIRNAEFAVKIQRKSD